MICVPFPQSWLKFKWMRSRTAYTVIQILATINILVCVDVHLLIFILVVCIIDYDLKLTRTARIVEYYTVIEKCKYEI